MVVTMCDSGAVKIKAGANVSTALTIEQYDELINQAESNINTETKLNLTDDYAGLKADVQKILDDACSSLAAQGAINFDMSGYTSRQEAIQMVNYNWAKANEALDKLKDKEVTTFMSKA